MKMKKLVLFTLMAFLVSMSSTIYANENEKDILGEWKYEVNSAPEGYNQGILAFAKTDGKLGGKLKLSDDYSIPMQNVSFENGELKFGLYVEGSYVTIKTKIEGDELKGTVETPEGPMPITAKKIK